MTLAVTLYKLAITLVHLTRLRRRRLEKGWTLVTLSKNAGLSVRTLSMLERSEREPRPQTITQLANALGCQPADMMEPEQ